MTEQARDTEALIRDQIAKHAVLLYMKGTPQFPQCGFSARAVEALSQIGRPFAYVNILKTRIFVQLCHKLRTGRHSHNFGSMVN